MYAAGFARNTTAIFTTAMADAWQLTVRWWQSVITTFTTAFTVTATWSLIGLAVIAVVVAAMFMSIMWYPLHHIFLSVAQGVWTPVGRPLVANVVLPVSEAVVEPATSVLEVINIYRMLPVKVVWDVSTLFLRCDGTSEFLASVKTAMGPFSNAIAGSVRIGVNATLARLPTNANASAVVAGQLCDGLSTITSGATALVACYCAPAVYAVDALTLILTDEHARCLFGNIITFTAETLAQTVQSLARITLWGMNAIEWIVDQMSEETRATAGGFPIPNATYLLPDVEKLTDVWNAASCCAGDLVDDIFDSALSVTSDMINRSAELSGGGVSSLMGDLELPVEARVGGVVRASGTVLSETFYLIWSALVRIASSVTTDGLLDAVKSIDENRLFDTYEAACIEWTGAFVDLHPASQVGLAGLANNSAVQSAWQAVTYALPIISTPAALLVPTVQVPITIAGIVPRATNASCRAAVHVMRGAAKLIRALPTYDEYTSGHFFDCAIARMQEVPEAIERDVNDVIDMIPAWQSCDTKSDGSIGLSCTRSMFDGSVGRLAAAPIGVYNAIIEWVVGVSENAHTFDEARAVPFDAIYDSLRNFTSATSGVLNGVLENIIPFDLMSFTLPDTNITLRLDRVFGISEVARTAESAGNLVIEILRFISRTAHRGDFTHWQFDPIDLQTLVAAEYDFANRTAHSFTSFVCAFKNAAADAGTPNACPYKQPGNFCPLNLFPCTDTMMSAVGRSIAELFNIIPKLVLTPSEFANRELLDGVLCELENAVVGLGNAFSGLNGVFIDLSDSWGTNATLDIGYTVPSVAYALVKVLTTANSLVIEAIHAIRYETLVTQAAPGCPSDRPIMLPGGICVSCSSSDAQTLAERTWTVAYPTLEQTVDPCNVILEAGLSCCKKTGQCTVDGMCFDSTRVRDEVDGMISSLLFASKTALSPMGVIDVHLKRALERMQHASIQTIRSVIDFVLVAPYESAGTERSYSATLANLGCSIDDLSWAVGHAIAIPISFTGHVMQLVGYFMGPTTTAELNPYTTGMNHLAASVGQAVSTVGAVAADTASFALASVGAMLEGDFSKERWATIMLTASSAMVESIDNLRVAVRSTVSALDISGEESFCELAFFVDAIIETVTSIQKQVVRAIGYSAAYSVSPYTGAERPDITEPITALRRLSLSVGNMAAHILYYVTDAVAGNAAEYKTLFDDIAGMIAATGNLWISMLDSWTQVIAVIVPDMGSVVDGVRVSTIGDTLAITGSALEVLLRSYADVMSRIYIFGTPYVSTLLDLLADMVHSLFVVQNSSLTLLLNRGFNFGKNILLVLICWSKNPTQCGTDISNAGYSGISFVSTIADVFFRIFLGVFDALIFPGVIVANDMGPFTCALNLIDCIWGDIWNNVWGTICPYIPFASCGRKRDDGGWSSASQITPEDSAQTLVVLAILFPETDSCRDTLLRTADDIIASNASGGVLPATSLITRYKTVQCIRYLFDTGLAWPYEEGDGTTDDLQTRAINRMSQHKRDVNVTVSDSSTSVLEDVSAQAFADARCDAGNPDNDPVCTLEPYARAAIALAHMGSASLEIVASTNTTRGIESFITGIADSGLSDQDIAYYTAIFTSAAKQSDAAVRDFVDTVLPANATDQLLPFANFLGGLSEILSNSSSDVWATAGREWGARVFTQTCGHSHVFSATYPTSELIDELPQTTCLDIDDECDAYGCPTGYVPQPWEPVPYECPVTSEYNFDVPDVCSPSARQCSNAPDTLNAYCSFLCGGPAATASFRSLCTSTASSSTGEVWSFTPESTGVSSDMFAQIYITDPDEDAVCTAFGRANSSVTDKWCRRACDLSSSSSFLSSLLAGSSPNYATAATICTDLCAPRPKYCDTEKLMICSTSATAMATCAIACDWNKNVPISCYAESSQQCSSRDPSLAELAQRSSCNCTSPHCACSYTFGASPAEISSNSNNVLDFFCPLTLKQPIAHAFANIDYDAVSDVSRVSFTASTTLSATSTAVTVPRADLDTFADDGLVYSAPTSRESVCTITNALRPLSQAEMTQYGLSQRSIASFTTPFTYYPSDTEQQWVTTEDATIAGIAIGQVTITTTATTRDTTTSAICGTWTVNTMSAVCPDPIDARLDGRCTDACGPSATYTTPGPACSSIVDARCLKDYYDPSNCVGDNVTVASVRVCGTLPPTLEFPVMTMEYRTDSPAVKVYWLYTRPNDLFDAYENSPFNLTEDDYHWGYAFPVLFEQEGTCNTATVRPSNTSLHSPIVFRDFIDTYGTAAQIAAPEYESYSSYTYAHSVLAKFTSRSSLCDVMCPEDAGQCLQLLPLDCTALRALNATLGGSIVSTLGARLWLCDMLPSVDLLTADMFPISSSAAAPAVTTVVTTKPNNPLTACGSSSSLCSVGAPSGPPDPPSQDVCDDIAEFAANYFANEYQRAVTSLRLETRSVAGSSSNNNNNNNIRATPPENTFRTCDIEATPPRICTRKTEPIPGGSTYQPSRAGTCNPGAPIVFPCERCAQYKWVPQNSTAAYLEMKDAGVWTSFKSTATARDSTLIARDELLVSPTALTELAAHVKAIQARMQSKVASVPPGRPPYAIMHLARALELAACEAVPFSPPCRRIRELMSARGTDIHQASRRPANTIREAVARGFWHQVLPDPMDMPSDCFVFCGLNWTSVLEDGCVWDAFDRYGAIGNIWDTIDASRGAVCRATSPTDGSEHYRSGGPLSLINMSAIDMTLAPRGVDNNGTSWLDTFAITKTLSDVIRRAIGAILGVTPVDLTTTELITAIATKALGKNDSSASTSEIAEFVFNINTDTKYGPVGLLYYILVPTPFGVNCAKLAGEVKLFGIPVWNPLWAGFPTWLPKALVSVSKWLTNVEMVAPDSLVRNDGGCRGFQDFNIPWTPDGECFAPAFKNCGESHGFITPFDSVSFLLNWYTPNLANSTAVSIIAKSLFLGNRLARFYGIANDPNANDYLYCFWLTSPGLIWIAFGLSLFIATAVWTICIIIILLNALFIFITDLVLAFIGWSLSLEPINYQPTYYDVIQRPSIIRTVKPKNK